MSFCVDGGHFGIQAIRLHKEMATLFFTTLTYFHGGNVRIELQKDISTTFK